MDEGQRDRKSRLVEFLSYPFIALLVLWIQVQALGAIMGRARNGRGAEKNGPAPQDEAPSRSGPITRSQAFKREHVSELSA
jgi:hypothetical protein